LLGYTGHYYVVVRVVLVFWLVVSVFCIVARVVVVFWLVARLLWVVTMWSLRLFCVLVGC